MLFRQERRFAYGGGFIGGERRTKARRLLKLALQCHASFARTLALLDGLKGLWRGRVSVIVDHDDTVP